MPELPEARRERMIAEYEITAQDAQVLTSSRAFADQFEQAAKAAKSPKRVANLVQGELLGRLKAADLELAQSPISMQGIAQAADLAESGALSSKMLKQLFDRMLRDRRRFRRCLRAREAAADQRFRRTGKND